MFYRHIFAVSVAVALVSCAEETAQQAAPPPAAPDVATPAPVAIPPQEVRADAEQCGAVTPHFAYDSAEPLLPAQGGLAQLAQCLGRSLDGDEAITLVGRADARGSSAYNQRLGLLRAQRVRSLLVQHGLSSERVVARSAGERGAMGFMEGHVHASDRRVDVLRPDGRVTLK